MLASSRRPVLAALAAVLLALTGLAVGRRTRRGGRPADQHQDQRGRVQRRHAGRLDRAQQHRRDRHRRRRAAAQGRRRHRTHVHVPGRHQHRRPAATSRRRRGGRSGSASAPPTRPALPRPTAHARRLATAGPRTPTTTYGRCPDGTGAFMTRRGADQGRRQQLPARRARRDHVQRGRVQRRPGRRLGRASTTSAATRWTSPA